MALVNEAEQLQFNPTAPLLRRRRTDRDFALLGIAEWLWGPLAVFRVKSLAMFAVRVSRHLYIAALATASLTLTSCADTRGGTIPYDHPLALPDPPTTTPLAEDYKISALDKLTIKVFKSDEMSGDYDVDLSGHISLPLVGEVEAASLTTAELDRKLTQLLGQKYFEHPDVSVAIKESTAHVVTLDGAVRQAGQYPVSGPMTLIQAVALARGTSDDANPRRVAIFRMIDGKRQAAAFDLTAIRRGQANDPPVYAGDIVVVDGSKMKALQKQILSTVPLVGLFRPVL